MKILLAGMGPEPEDQNMQEFMAEIRKMLQDKELERLKEILNAQEAYKLKNLLTTLGNEEKWDEMVILFRLLDKDLSLDVFEKLSLHMQERLIQSFTHDKAYEILEGMEPDDRARLLAELPAKVTKRLLGTLTQDEYKKTAVLLGHAPETAGRIMTPEYVSLKADMTTDQALDRIRSQRKRAETIYVLYVTDAGRKLLGVLSLADLVTAEKSVKVGEIMNEQVIRVHTATDQEEVAHLLRDRDLLALPVVDSEDRLVGIVTVDDAMDILGEETTEDMFKKAGIGPMLYKSEELRSSRLISGPWLNAWKVRLPFLLITLAGGLLAGAVINAFEETLEAVVVLAVFIPVVMDMGGNVGTQSSTIFARAFVLGQINMKRFTRHFFREVGIGACMGLFLGLAALFVAFLWKGIPEIGYTVGLALFFTITLATALGFLIPYILIRMGLDQAAGSDPIITTIKDISGLAIYFFLAHLFMGHLF